MRVTQVQTSQPYNYKGKLNLEQVIKEGGIYISDKQELKKINQIKQTLKNEPYDITMTYGLHGHRTTITHENGKVVNIGPVIIPYHPDTVPNYLKQIINLMNITK